MSEDKDQQRRPSDHTNDSSMSRESPVEDDNNDAPQGFYDEDVEARRTEEFKENGTELKRTCSRMSEHEQDVLTRILSSVSRKDIDHYRKWVVVEIIHLYYQIETLIE